jgi:ribosomal protein L40E
MRVFAEFLSSGHFFVASCEKCVIRVVSSAEWRIRCFYHNLRPR